jgi:hypothetical protein
MTQITRWMRLKLTDRNHIYFRRYIFKEGIIKRRNCALIWAPQNSKVFKSKVWIKKENNSFFYKELESLSLEEAFFKINLLLNKFNYDIDIFDVSYIDVDFDELIGDI